MKKVGAVLGMVSLLSFVVTTGAFAADNLPWKLVKGSTFLGADVENPRFPRI